MLKQNKAEKQTINYKTTYTVKYAMK